MRHSRPCASAPCNPSRWPCNVGNAKPLKPVDCAGHDEAALLAHALADISTYTHATGPARLEPVYGAAVDQAGVLAQALAEGCAHGAHAQRDVQVAPARRHKERPHLRLRYNLLRHAPAEHADRLPWPEIAAALVAQLKANMPPYWLLRVQDALDWAHIITHTVHQRYRYIYAPNDCGLSTYLRRRLQARLRRLSTD